MKSSSLGLEQKRNSLRSNLALQRANVVRYVAGHPGCTSAEIGKALGVRPQNIGQVLHKMYEVRNDEGKWYLRHLPR